MGYELGLLSLAGEGRSLRKMNNKLRTRKTESPMITMVLREYCGGRDFFRRRVWSISRKVVLDIGIL